MRPVADELQVGRRQQGGEQHVVVRGDVGVRWVEIVALQESQPEHGEKLSASRVALLTSCRSLPSDAQQSRVSSPTVFPPTVSSPPVPSPRGRGRVRAAGRVLCARR